MEMDESSRKSVENERSGSKAGFWAWLLIFYSFSITFIWFHPLTFISDHFHSSLLIFLISLVSDRFQLIWELSLIFTFFYIIFNYFNSFSAIFDCFRSLFNIFAHISSPLTITTHFWLPLLNFNHFRQFTVTLTHLNCFSSYIHKYELVYICYYLYLTNDTYFWFLQFIYYLFL